MTAPDTRARAIPHEQFHEEWNRRGGGGPEDDGPDLFRVFRHHAQTVRNDAKRLLRPLLPAAADQTVTPELETFNRIARGGFWGTMTALHVLASYKIRPLRRDI